MKKVISFVLCFIFMLNLITQTVFADNTKDTAVFLSNDCIINYTIVNEWDGNQQINVSITNNSEEPIRNWAVKFDTQDSVINPWNALVYINADGICVLRNCTYNYEISPNESISFGFQLQGDNLTLPSNITLCNKTIDSTSDCEVDYDIYDSWDGGFAASISITNISNNPLEAWFLSFDGNFQIDDLWNANLTVNDRNHYIISSDINSNPIGANETKTFNIRSTIASGEIPLFTNFHISSVVIDENIDSQPNDSDEPIEIGVPVLDVVNKYEIATLFWDFQRGCNAYNIYKAIGDGDFELIAKESENAFYMDYEIVEGNEYSYKITASYDEIESEYSNIVTITASAPANSEEDINEPFVTDIMRVINDSEELQIDYMLGDSRDSVTQDLFLTETGYYGSSIKWTTENADVVSETGKITRPISTEDISITAYISSGNFSTIKNFTVTVIQKPSYEKIDEITLDSILEISNGDAVITYDDNGYIVEIDGLFTNHIIEAPEDALSLLAAMTGLTGLSSNDFRLMFVHNGAYVRNYVFRQYYNNMPIYGSEYTLRTDKTGIVKHLYLTNYDESILGNVNLIPEISGDEAANLAKITLTKDAELSVYIDDEIYLVWALEGYNDNGNGTFFINAINGSVINYNIEVDEITQMAKANNLLGEEIEFPVNMNKLGIFNSKRTEYELKDSRTDIIVYYAENGAENPVKSEIATNSDNLWYSNEEVEAITAYDNLITVYDFYQDVFGLDSFDGNGARIHAYIFDHSGYDNAACSDKIIYDRNTTCFLFGNEKDDGSTLNYAADLGVVAHEYTHAIARKEKNNVFANHQNNLITNGYGALSEAYADIMSELMEIYLKGENSESWLVGNDMYVVGGTQCLRNISNPNDTSNPESYYGSYFKIHCTDDTHEQCKEACKAAGDDWDKKSCDKGFIHNNSTVISHAAYLMYTNGLDVETLLQLWYNSMDYYRYYKCDDAYTACYNAIISAAGDMNLSALQINIIESAFEDVEITQSKTYNATITLVDDSLEVIDWNGTADLYYTDKIHCTANGYKYTTDNSCCKYAKCKNNTYTCDPFECSISYNDSGCCHILNYKQVNFINGVCEIPDMLQGYVRISVDGITEYYNVDTTALSLLTFDETGEILTGKLDLIPKPKASVSGKVVIADSDTDLTNNAALSGAKLHFERDSLGIKSDITTSEDGTYNLSNLMPGKYKVTVEKAGYITLIERISLNQGVNNVNITLELISDEFDGLGIASGSIVDATSGNGVEGLTLNIRKGVNNTKGVTIDTLVTSTSGNYKTGELEAGNYCIEIIDPSNIYKNSTVNIKILGNHQIANQNGVVTQNIASNQMRVVLTWGATPKDLDSHTLIKIGDSNSCHVYYGDKDYYIDGKLNVLLDLDDTSSYGPETTTIYDTSKADKYTFYVYNYSGGNNALSSSGAKVEIYHKDKYYCLFVPNGTGRYWNVFSFDSSTESFIFTNKISSYTL